MSNAAAIDIDGFEVLENITEGGDPKDRALRVTAGELALMARVHGDVDEVYAVGTHLLGGKLFEEDGQVKLLVRRNVEEKLGEQA